MGFLHLIGLIFLTFGPLILLAQTIILNPIKCITFVASSFFALLAMLCTSFIWYAFVPLRDKLLYSMIVSVFVQILFKYLWYKVLKLSFKNLQKFMDLDDNEHANKAIYRKFYFVSGVGFGFITSGLAVINSLAQLLGPGTFGIDGKLYYIYIITKCISANIFISLNICWALILYMGLDTKHYSKVVLVVLTHLLAVLITYFNKYSLHYLTIGALSCTLLILIFYTLYLCEFTWTNFKVSFSKCREDTKIYMDSIMQQRSNQPSTSH